MNTWNSLDQIMGLYCSQCSHTINSVQFLLKGWMWLRVVIVHTRCKFTSLEKQRFTARLFQRVSRAMWGLGLTQPPSFCLLEGQCTCCCSFLLLTRGLSMKFFLQCSWNVYLTYARVTSCWIFFVSGRQNVLLCCANSTFPYTLRQSFSPSQQGSKVLTGVLQK